MDLKEIQNPSFLKSMTISQLNDLAADIRDFLIHSVAKTGGHLASNLGVVELTIALHYVFNSPEDKLFFDVGHQSYVHKILTGRAKDFDTLRQYGGISGFQKRKESVHDVWEAGHSSTSLSAALGIAIARDLSNDDFNVIPIVGDGALSSGMSLEALNQIGYERRKIIIIFNDNNMSISKNVGAMTRNFAKLRTATAYTDLKDNMKKSLYRNDLGKVMYYGMKSVKDAVRDSMIDSGIFGEFNLDYLGPVDGHDIHALINALKATKRYDGPVIVHVITQKGKGYAPCEMDFKGSWHGVGPFNVSTSKPLRTTPIGFKSWSKAIADSVLEEADLNDKIVALTPAMINGSALNEFFAKYPKRSFDCGITEDHTAVLAASLALSGMRPFFAVYSSFLQRCYDQINHDICRMDVPVVIGIDRAGLVGDDGETHHGVFDIGLLKPIPNIILAQPKNAYEARCLIKTAFNQQHPFAIRYPRGEVKTDTSTSLKLIEIGTWELLNSNDCSKAVVLTYGPDVERVLDKVLVNSLPVAIVNCRFFKPLDYSMLDQLAERNLPLFIYETDVLAGGLGSSILEYYNECGMNPEINRYGIHDEFVPQGAINLLRKDENCDINTLFNDLVMRIK